MSEYTEIEGIDDEGIDDEGIQIDIIDTWSKYNQDKYAKEFSEIQKNAEIEKPAYPVNVKINDKVSLWKGDITRLQVDAIVNAANRSLLGGGGFDGCIHRAAGSGLLEECRALNGCDTGDAQITPGYKLPAKYVIHTVGPIGKNEKALENCYKNCLRLALENKVRTLAFCCISTGIYGYPNRDAAEVALKTTRKWLEDESNANAIDRIIFCLFLEKDIEIYHTLMLKYFPPEKPAEETTEVPATPEKDKSKEIKESGKKELKVDDAKKRDEKLGTKSEKDVESEKNVKKKVDKKMETEQNEENGDVKATDAPLERKKEKKEMETEQNEENGDVKATDTPLERKKEKKEMETEQNEENGGVKATDTPLGAGEDASSLKAEGTKNKEKETDPDEEMEKVEEMQKRR